ncbi:MAG: DUF2071 domain-containing protein [Ferruginibacter sp.]|nr:DUF2071 domain-containing protein [Cytophagales bacterium]
MNLLEKIPVRYVGELHDVRLINFSVDKSEVESRVPWHLVVRDFGGRAMISMVDVSLKRMHPSFVPESLHVNYRHVSFRLLLEDSHRNVDGQNRGLFFLESFTDQPLIAQGGRWMTDYNLELATMVATDEQFTLKQRTHAGDRWLHYALDGQVPKGGGCEGGLQEIVGALDRAYSVRDGQVRMVRIQPEKWPIERVNCTRFETNFFRTARLEGAFRVKEMIHYQWHPSQAG